MKYGMRERVSGIIILVALAVIFLPLLFSEPAPRGEGPEPVLTVEQPIDLPRNNVSQPASPLPPESTIQDESDNGGAPSPSAMTQSSQLLPAQSEPAQVPGPSPRSTSTPQRSTPKPTPAKAQEDPIMAAAARGSAASSKSGSDAGAVQTATSNGEWSVQAGSFGEPGNADRLVAQLKEQGFTAYKKPRGNLTTVFVGPFTTSEEGERARAQLQQKANIKGLVVRRKDSE